MDREPTTPEFLDIAEEMRLRRRSIRARLGLPPAGEAVGCSTGSCTSCGTACSPGGEASPGMSVLSEAYEVC
jgi:thiazolylpeptide-type bacteriocin precursor